MLGVTLVWAKEEGAANRKHVVMPVSTALANAAWRIGRLDLRGASWVVSIMVSKIGVSVAGTQGPMCEIYTNR